MLPDDPRHGSEAGYGAELKAGLATCEACRRAHRRENKRRLLADAPPRKVLAIGSQRRVQALQRLGYSRDRICREIGYTDNGSIAYLMRAETMLAVTAAKIAEAYERLSMTIPETSGAVRARTWAARNGYAPPLAWDDGTIDDPDAKPAGMGSGAHHALTRGDELLHLAHHGETLETACTKLGISRDSLWRWCRRNGHRDLYERLAQRPEPRGDDAMSADDPRHGTVNGYLNQGCRCGDCRAAGTADRMARKRRAAEKVAA